MVLEKGLILDKSTNHVILPKELERINMKNLVFVIWMLGFPIVNSLGDYLLFLREKKYSESTDLISSILFLVIWVFVGRLLYEEKSTKPAETKVPELAQEESEV